MVKITIPGREVFCVLAWLDCNSGGEVMQVFSTRGTAQILRGNRQGKGSTPSQGQTASGSVFLSRFKVYVFFIKKHIDWVIVKSANGIVVFNKWANEAALLIKNW